MTLDIFVLLVSNDLRVIVLCDMTTGSFVLPDISKGPFDLWDTQGIVKSLLALYNMTKNKLLLLEISIYIYLYTE